MLLNNQPNIVRMACNDPYERTAPLQSEARRIFEDFLESLVLAQVSFSKSARVVAQARGLGPRGARILELLSTGLVYPSQLSSSLGVRRNLISMDLVRLSQARLIRSRPSRSDRRRTVVELTPAGEQLVRARAEETLQFVMRKLSGHEPAEITGMSKILRKIGSDHTS